MSLRPEVRSLLLWLLLGGVLVATVGLVDQLTGEELSLSLFYLVPIAAGSWYAGRSAGLILALAGAVVWFVADASGQRYSFVSIGYWNASIRFGFFVVVVLLLTALRSTLHQVSELSLSDPLTGAANTRAFLFRLEGERVRSERQGTSYSVAYIDLDNFKSVNDSAGHAAGDEVLRTVVDTMKRSLRAVDLVARLGGDEFALLLPDTGPEAVRAVIEKVRRALLEAMRSRHLPVTFSIGVITVSGSGTAAEAVLQQADSLMYRVKRDGKDAVHYLGPE